MRAEVHVHPDFRGLGLGTLLLGWVEARGRAKHEPKTRQPIVDKDTGSAEMLRLHGYTMGHVGWIFEIAFDERPAEARLPRGVAIRGFLPGQDERAVYQVVEDAFNGWPDRQPMAFEDWRAAVLLRPEFDPRLLHIALEGTQIVGVCLGLDYPDEGGWVQQLAVKASHRNRGIAKALLQRAFCTTWDRGQKTCGLFTDSRTGARGLYERVGMHARMTTTSYEKDL
jgi:GNAT superfamily N-acetyltransferase